MKNGWPIKTLGDLFDITSSKRVFEADWKSEGVPFYRAREIVKLAKQGFVDNELFISEEMFKQYSAKYGIPTAGDIMVTGVGTLGICFVVKEGDRFYFKDGNIIWLKKKSDTNSRFVEYAFQSDFLRKQIDDSVGATVGTFTIIKAKSTRIPVPPLPEQQRIVGILDETFSGIATAKANAEKNLQNARALFENHLQSTFTQRGPGWMEKSLGEVCLLKSGTTVNPTLERSTGDLPYLKVADMSHPGNELEIVSSTRFVNEADIGRNAIFPSGTTIFPKRGGAIFTNKKRLTVVPICTDTNIMGVIPSKALLPKFLFFYFLNVDMRQLGSGSSIPQINNYDIEPLVISFPQTTSQQMQIVCKLEELSTETQRLESIYQQKLAALVALKKSLLHQAFSGEL